MVQSLKPNMSAIVLATLALMSGSATANTLDVDVGNVRSHIGIDSSTGIEEAPNHPPSRAVHAGSLGSTVGDGAHALVLKRDTSNFDDSSDEPIVDGGITTINNLAAIPTASAEASSSESSDSLPVVDGGITTVSSADAVATATNLETDIASSIETVEATAISTAVANGGADVGVAGTGGSAYADPGASAENGSPGTVVPANATAGVDQASLTSSDTYGGGVAEVTPITAGGSVYENKGSVASWSFGGALVAALLL